VAQSQPQIYGPNDTNLPQNYSLFSLNQKPKQDFSLDITYAYGGSILVFNENEKVIFMKSICVGVGRDAK